MGFFKSISKKVRGAVKKAARGTPFEGSVNKITRISLNKPKTWTKAGTGAAELYAAYATGGASAAAVSAMAKRAASNVKKAVKDTPLAKVGRAAGIARAMAGGTTNVKGSRVAVDLASPTGMAERPKPPVVTAPVATAGIGAAALLLLL